MPLDDEAAVIEAVLFLENEPVEPAAISKITKLGSEVVTQALDYLADKYDEPHHGLELVHIADGYHLQPKEHLLEALRDRYGKKNDSRLSRAALETLSIVAYSQPITRVEIENLRGVNADGMIRLLLSRELIKEVGRKETPGKPVQYGTTKQFLKLFRLSSISELPKLDELEEERFRSSGEGESDL
jgi:segregation and condensation protein B